MNPTATRTPILAESPTSIPSSADQLARQAATPRAELDRTAGELSIAARRWAATAPRERARLLARLRASFARVADRWVEACLEAEEIPPANPAAAEEWLGGPYLVLRNLRLLEESLRDLARGRRPRIPGRVEVRPDGRVTARVFPFDLWDRILYSGITADVWLEPDVDAEAVGETQSRSYFGDEPGGVALVLGAGNVSSIGPMDALYKLFVENRVVLFKAHPVNDYLGPLLEEGFAPLVERGFLRVVYGGAEEGAYLCRHEAVDEIHITGSDKTVEAIVFGPGEEGARRKAERRPLLEKPISSELGNVSPVIVVPGPWSVADLAYHAENLVSMLVNNAGFNCNAVRVIVTHREWPQRRALLDKVRELLAETPLRKAYYPGAERRWRELVARHPEAERFGRPDGDQLPWTLIAGLDREAPDEVCYTTEAFCGLCAELPISAPTAAGFVDEATRFANERLWGTLNATILVHPSSERDAELGPAIERAIAGLRYGAVSVNHWAAIAYGLVTTPWGAYPGHDLYDIQSGTGFVHNTPMLSRIEKSVTRAPFRARPKPPWFVTHPAAHEIGRQLCHFEAAPSAWRLAAVFRAVLGGVARS